MKLPPASREEKGLDKRIMSEGSVLKLADPIPSPSSNLLRPGLEKGPPSMSSLFAALPGTLSKAILSTVPCWL